MNTHGDAAYCAKVLAPIWERWMDNAPLLRQALAKVDADEAARVRQRQRLIEAINGLVPRRSDPGINAAVCAALAVLCVLGGDMDTDFWAVAEQAIAKDQEARTQGTARAVSDRAGTDADGKAAC